MLYPVTLKHPSTNTEVEVEQGSPRYRRLRLAGWTEIFRPVPEVPAAPAAPTRPAWPSMPDDLDTEVDLSEED